MSSIIEVVDDRKIIKIAVRPSAKQAVENFAREYDMKEFAVASALYEWFADQDDVFQRAVMGMLHGLEVDAAAEFMRRQAGKLQGKPVRAAAKPKPKPDDK